MSYTEDERNLKGKTVQSVTSHSGNGGNNSVEIQFTDGSWINFHYYGGNSSGPIIYIADKEGKKK